MQSKASFSWLRRVLAIDAVSSAAMGLGLLVLAPTLAPLLNLPLDLLREAGAILLPFAALVGYLASREQPARAGVWTVIALNAVWTVDSIVLLLSGWVEPNGLGYAFVIGQAVVVGVFAELEYVGLRRASLAAAS
ncbi:MAG TPA: hypothetical protein VNA21_16915 [Steroidobacteraceae bacterium]|nr:hypothetical protein [Steroidobacteraceae bacterium]